MVPIRAIRSLGAMTAFDVVDRATGAPAPQLVKQIQACALEAGLVLLSCGAYGHTIRLLMPLTIEDDVLEEGIAMLELALRRAEAGA